MPDDAPMDERATSEGPERPPLVVSFLRLIGFCFMVGGGVMGAAYLTAPLFGTLGDRTDEELSQPVVHGTSPFPQWFWVAMSLLGAGWCLIVLSRSWRSLRR
ncbi:MAG: hypothetical protein ACAI25_07895 [Planctomycetota bacterium]